MPHSELPKDGNGFTQKEMLVMVLEGQKELESKIDSLNTQVQSKVSKMELMGYILMVSAVLMIATNWQMLTG